MLEVGQYSQNDQYSYPWYFLCPPGQQEEAKEDDDSQDQSDDIKVEKDQLKDGEGTVQSLLF